MHECLVVFTPFVQLTLTSQAPHIFPQIPNSFSLNRSVEKRNILLLTEIDEEQAAIAEERRNGKGKMKMKIKWDSKKAYVTIKKTEREESTDCEG